MHDFRRMGALLDLRQAPAGIMALSRDRWLPSTLETRGSVRGERPF